MRRSPSSRLARTLPVAALLACAWGSPALAQIEVPSRDPTPFRGDDEVEGRDFEFDDDAFLLRHSYRFRPAQEERWWQEREGYRGVAGSVRTDEFYAFQEIRKQILVESPFLFHIRHRRDEDFDGRYDVTKIGAGVLLPRGWLFSVLSDIVAEKSEIDVEFEGSWRNDSGSYFRGSFLLVDWLFNEKSDVGQDRKRPYTFFADGRAQLPCGVVLDGWVNWNTDTRRRFEVEGFDFTYRRFLAGGRATLPVAERWALRFAVDGETGDADRRGTPDPLDESRLARRHLRTEGELRHFVGPKLEFFLGGRYFRLSEDQGRPLDPANDGELVRREPGVFGGFEWRVQERVLIWPSVAIAFLDNDQRLPGNPALDDTERSAIGVVSLPMEARLGERAKLTMQVNLMLNRPEFGGGAVRVEVPF